MLDGTPIPGALVATNYPAGSRSYTGLGGVTSIDGYGLWNYNGANSSAANHIWGVTDLTGATMASVPTADTAFCANGFVFTPIAGAAAGADNYNMYGTMGGCTSASIAAATGPVAPGSLTMIQPMGTIMLSTKTTGNAVVPSVGIATVSAAAITAAGANGALLAQANNCIIGVVGGVAEVGCPGPYNHAGFTPAGTPIPNAINSSNKIAVDAELIANGYIALP